MIDFKYKGRIYTASWLWDCGIYDLANDEVATLSIYLDEVAQVALLVDEGDERVYTITHVSDNEYYALDFNDKENCYGNAKHHILDKIAQRLTRNLGKKGLLYAIYID